MPVLIALYRGLTHLAGPVVRRLLDRRLAMGKEEGERLPERLGHAGRPRPSAPLIWVHAASVGESMAVLPLVGRLLELPSRPRVLVTTGTVTSARLLAQRLPHGAFHQFIPVDLPSAVDRFLDHWRPDLALWVESEFWPNLLTGLRRRAIPAVLVNARLSAKSHRGWRRVARTARHLLSCFPLALAQTAVEAQRLRDLGIQDARAVGNLKYSTPPLPVDEAALTALQAALGTRPRWVMASTHPGEEALAIATHRLLAPRLPGLLTLIVPRHPARGATIADDARRDGWTVGLRGDAHTPPTPGEDVHVADTLGELGLFFRVAPVAVVGGSFAPIGGHNPIEPAQLGAAVVYGPHMHNFAEIARSMEDAGGAVRLPLGLDAGGAAQALADTLAHLLTDADARRTLADKGAAVAAANRDAIDKVMAALRPALDEVGLLAPRGDGLPPRPRTARREAAGRPAGRRLHGRPETRP